MGSKEPPNQPLCQLNRGLNRFRQQKRCDDVSLSRQEGSTMLHLANADSVTSPAGGNTGQLFLLFGGTGHAKQYSMSIG